MDSDDRRANNEALLDPIIIDLNGSQRFLIANFIEKIPNQDRTEQEKDLLKKVR